MSIAKATIEGNVTTYEQIAAPGAISSTAAKASVLYDGFDSSHELTGATTPAVDTPAFAEITLTAGAATLDLTAVACLDGTIKDFTGKKIRAIKFRVKAANAGAFTIAKGASNGYTGFGSAFSVTLPANAGGGAWVQFYDAGVGTAVSGSVKTLDITGTGTQVLQVAILGGS